MIQGVETNALSAPRTLAQGALQVEEPSTKEEIEKFSAFAECADTLAKLLRGVVDMPIELVR